MKRGWERLRRSQRIAIVGFVVAPVMTVLSGSPLWISFGMGMLVVFFWPIWKWPSTPSQLLLPRGEAQDTNVRRHVFADYQDERRHEIKLAASASVYAWPLEKDGEAERPNALSKLRLAVPGFPESRYNTALDHAVSVLRGIRERNDRMHHNTIAYAHTETTVNAVFRLRYFNKRYASQSQLGPIPIDTESTLEALYNRSEIDVAGSRVDELWAGYGSSRYGAASNEEKLQHLKTLYPDFADDNLRMVIDFYDPRNR